jgi:predicted RNase H-related nuclease YkuK (DUF458 family)
MSLKKAIVPVSELQFDLEIVKAFINTNPTAKIYIGGDSTRLKKQKVRYATVVCVHYDGSKGAKVFGEISYGTIIDAKIGRPINRMLEEVNKIIEMYTRLEDVLIERIEDVAIHLDINPNKTAGSSVAHGAAKGMIMGVIGIEPMFKPDAFSASFAADRYCNM